MRWIHQSVVVSAFVVLSFTIVSVVQYILVSSGYWQPSSEHAQSGDMFGLANAISSALAFALLIVTLRLQSIELKEQREQFKKMADAQTASDQKMLLQTYLSALSLEANYECDQQAKGATFVETLENIISRIRYGGRAQWVRRKAEAELNGLPSPESLAVGELAAAERLLKYWRILANFLDREDYTPIAWAEFSRKVSPMFEAQYWNKLPENELKSILVPLRDRVLQTEHLATSSRGHDSVAELVRPIKEKFVPIVKTMCLPTQPQKVL